MKQKTLSILTVVNTSILTLFVALIVMGATYYEGIFVTRPAGAAFFANMPGDTDCRWRALVNGVLIWCDGTKPIAGMGPVISEDGQRLLFELNSSSSNLLPNGERLSVGISFNGGPGKIWSFTAEPEGFVVRNEYTGEILGLVEIDKSDYKFHLPIVTR